MRAGVERIQHERGLECLRRTGPVAAAAIRLAQQVLGRHAIDGAWPELSTEDREFRAKLSEVTFAPHPRLALDGILDANMGDPTPHGQADRRAMEGVLAWMTSHAGEIAGLDRAAPLLPQLPLLTDAQLRAAFGSLDPFAR
jgi:hypothetical protein